MLLSAIAGSAMADSTDVAPGAAVLHHEEDSIWISINTGNQQQELQLYPARSLKLEIEPSGESDILNAEIGPDLAKTENESLESFPEVRGAYDAGFEIRTYRLLGPGADISPAIIMVNEHRTDETFYFGFLSISIRF